VPQQVQAAEKEKPQSDIPAIPPGVTPSIGLYVTSDGGGMAAKMITPMIANGLVKALSGGGKLNTANRTDDINKLLGPAQSGNLSAEQMKNISDKLGIHYLCITKIIFGAGGSFGLEIRLVNAAAARTVTNINMKDLNKNTIPKVMLDIGRELMEALKDILGPAMAGAGTAQPTTHSGKAAGSQTSRTVSEPVARKESGKKTSLGFGAFYSGDYGGGVRCGDHGAVAMPYNGGGMYIFFDAIYAEFILGYSGGGGEWETPNNIGSRELPDMRRSIVSFGAFFKTQSATESAGDVKAFPLAGIEYEIAEAKLYINGKYNTRSEVNALWFKLGGGLNIGLSEGSYLRAEALYGWRTANEFEKDSVNDYFYGDDTRLGHGLTLKCAIGFNF
jgi:hypothetical protein